MAKPLLVFISCEDKVSAERIGERLLTEKLAVCVQILNHADSLFLWPPGKHTIDYASETLLLVKTLDSKWDALEKTVIHEHDYENPEIIAIPLFRVTKKYLSWMVSELS